MHPGVFSKEYDLFCVRFVILFASVYMFVNVSSGSQLSGITPRCSPGLLKIMQDQVYPFRVIYV